MTPAVLDRPGALFADSAPGAERTAGAERAAISGPAPAAERLGDGRMTLEERLNAALHEARTNGSAECPVCHGPMTCAGDGGEGAAAVVADCGGCGSQLT